jgi:hypothetical protein
MTLWDTHAATLSAKAFRALMATVAIFDLFERRAVGRHQRFCARTIG